MFWFIFCKTDLLITQQPDGTWSVPAGDKPPVELKAWHTVHNVAPVAGINESVKAVLTDHPPTSLLSPNKQTVSSPNDQTASSAPHKEGQERSPYEMCPLRQSYYKLPYALYLMAGKCQEILYWDSNTKFCGVCGAPMKLHTDISKRCTNCGKEVWPQLATAVIVLVRRGTGEQEELLLVKNRNFRRDFYGCVSGFVATWYLVAFILVLAIASTLVIGHGSQGSTNDSISSEIVNEGAPASETPAFPMEIPQTDPTAE